MFLSFRSTKNNKTQRINAIKSKQYLLESINQPQSHPNLILFSKRFSKDQTDYSTHNYNQSINQQQQNERRSSFQAKPVGRAKQTIKPLMINNPVLVENSERWSLKSVRIRVSKQIRTEQDESIPEMSNKELLAKLQECQTPQYSNRRKIIYSKTNQQVITDTNLESSVPLYLQQEKFDSPVRRNILDIIRKQE